MYIYLVAQCWTLSRLEIPLTWHSAVFKAVSYRRMASNDSNVSGSVRDRTSVKWINCLLKWRGEQTLLHWSDQYMSLPLPICLDLDDSWRQVATDCHKYCNTLSRPSTLNIYIYYGCGHWLIASVCHHDYDIKQRLCRMRKMRKLLFCHCVFQRPPAPSYIFPFS